MFGCLTDWVDLGRVTNNNNNASFSPGAQYGGWTNPMQYPVHYFVMSRVSLGNVGRPWVVTTSREILSGHYAVSTFRIWSQTLCPNWRILSSQFPTKNHNSISIRRGRFGLRGLVQYKVFYFAGIPDQIHGGRRRQWRQTIDRSEHVSRDVLSTYPWCFH